LLAHLARLFPQNRFFLHDPRQFVHASDLSPDHLQDKGNHHYQPQAAFTKAQAMKVTHLPKGRRVNNLLDAISDFLIRWRRNWMLDAVLLNCASMPNATLFSGLGFLAHSAKFTLFPQNVHS
jgi:hypothetical protein